MKGALYIEGPDIQLIITPEDEKERELLRLFDTKKVTKTFWGNFGKCEGGWYRKYEDEDSLIFLLENKEKPEK